MKKTNPVTPQIVNQKIDIRSAPHATQDISNWKAAIKAFESVTSPNRQPLYDLYEDILLDGQVECCWGKRQDAILNSDLVFMRNGEVDDEITKLLYSPDMREIVRHLHDTIAWGFTLIQVNRIYFDHDQQCYRIDFDLIPRKHVHPEPAFRSVSIQQGLPARDFLFDQDPLRPYMLFAGNPADKGLLVKAAQYVIYKRGGYGDWAQFSELFGMPFREMTYEDYDDATRLKLEDMLQNWGAAAWCVHPKSAELTIHDSGSSAASSDIYDTLISRCDAAISKCILGNTLTTEQGDSGARSLGEVHKEVEDAKFLSDRRYTESILNTSLRAILSRFGFNLSGGYISFCMPDLDWNDIQAKWNVLRDIYNTIPIDDDYIYEALGIPKPDNYEQLKAQLDSRLNDAPQPDTAPSVKNSLSQRIKDFFA